MKDYYQANRDVWEGWTAEEFTPAFALIERFKAGHESLRPFEVEELGDVGGKSLLHLQCHFGLDTLSWARRGAKVTGADFAERSIRLARSLAEETNIEAEFVCANLYELPDVLDERFDIVYTSFGVLAWLHDIDEWGRVVAGLLKPGRTFYVAEYHPITYVLDDEANEPIVRNRYFPTEEPVAYKEPRGRPVYGWRFTLGGVLSALTQAGLRIEFLHEFSFSESPHMSFLEPKGPGRWILPHRFGGELPLMFSIRAVKDPG